MPIAVGIARAIATIGLSAVYFQDMFGLITFDNKDSSLNRAQSYTNSIGYGVLPWWKIELEGELASGGGQPLTCHA